MITLTYDTPSNGDTRVQGTWTDGTDSGTFDTKVIYSNGAIDIALIEDRVKKAIEG